MTHHLPTTRYIVRTMALMSVYVAINVAAIAGVFDRLNSAGHVGLALVVAVPIACQIWAVIAWMRDSDEFFRAMTVKRFVLATGLTIAVASAWGFQELYAHAPHISAAMVYPLFWGAFGVVTPFVRSSRI